MLSTSPSGRASPHPLVHGRSSPVREPTAVSYNQAVSRGRVDKRSHTAYTPALRENNPWASLFQNSGLSPAFLQKSPTVEKPPLRAEVESIPDPGFMPRSSASENSEAETRYSIQSTSPQNLSGVEEAVKERPGCKSVADYFGAVPGAKEHSPGRLSALQNSVNAKYLEGQHSLSQSMASNLSTADAEQMLDDFKNHKLQPPKAYHESPEARQKIIDALEAETRGINEPGGSWVPRPGQLPYARALPKSPDKDYLDHSTSLGAERQSLLKRLRWAFISVGKDHHFRVMDHFARYDEDGSGCVTRNNFFRVLSEISFETSTSDYDLMITLFQSRRKRGYMDYGEFAYRMFEATKEMRINVVETDREELARRMRQSCVFDHLNTLRPMSRSGRLHTMSDIHKQIDKPLVLPAGTGTVPGKYQFMSDHQRQKLQKRFPEPSAPRETQPAQTRTASSQQQPSGFGHYHSEPVIQPPEPKSVQEPEQLQEQLQEQPNLFHKQPTLYTLVIDEDQSAATEKITTDVQMLSIDESREGESEGRTPSRASGSASPSKRAQTPPILKGINGRVSTKERAHSVSFTEDVNVSPTAMLEQSRAGWEANVAPDNTIQQPMMTMIRPLAGGQPAVTRAEHLPTIDGTTRRVTGKSPHRRDPPSGLNDDQDAIRRMAAAEILKPHTPSWSVQHRWTAHPLNMSQNLAHDEGDGENRTKLWQSSNLCNQDIPTIDRLAMFNAVQKDHMKNASARSTSWSFSHSGATSSPSQWSSTTKDQQSNRPRVKTPVRCGRRVPPTEPVELRPPPWSVAERHLVHLQQYDHRILGLPRPEPLARKSL